MSRIHFNSFLCGHFSLFSRVSNWY
uniref:Uncharacterized protein n=1 Tax=Anguilla anguilla TaxID=7936 RepID=A0A0E9THL7_ANGAN